MLIAAAHRSEIGVDFCVIHLFSMVSKVMSELYETPLQNLIFIKSYKEFKIEMLCCVVFLLFYGNAEKERKTRKK